MWFARSLPMVKIQYRDHQHSQTVCERHHSYSHCSLYCTELTTKHVVLTHQGRGLRNTQTHGQTHGNEHST